MTRSGSACTRHRLSPAPAIPRAKACLREHPGAESSSAVGSWAGRCGHSTHETLWRRRPGLRVLSTWLKGGQREKQKQQDAGERAVLGPGAWALAGPATHFAAPCHPLPRMKPAGSVNDVALDAFDLDRMKQVSVSFPEAVKEPEAGDSGPRGQAGPLGPLWPPSQSGPAARRVMAFAPSACHHQSEAPPPPLALPSRVHPRPHGRLQQTCHPGLGRELWGWARVR